MATAVFDVNVTKAKKDHIVLRVTYLEGDGTVGLEPVLLLRILGEKLGLDHDDLYDERKIEELLKSSFQSFAVLKTMKNFGDYKIGLKEELAQKFTQGDTWESYDYGSEQNITVDMALSTDGKIAMTGYRSNLYPEAASATLEGVKKTGFGTIKAWLNHPYLVGIGCGIECWWTAGNTSVYQWNDTGKKILEEFSFETPVTSLCTHKEITALGTEAGQIILLPEKKVIAELESPIVHLSINGDHCAAVTKEKLFIGTLSQGLSPVGIELTEDMDLKVVFNEEGTWLAAAGVDRAWKGTGDQYEAHEELRQKEYKLCDTENFPATLVNNLFYSTLYNYNDIVSLDCTTGEFKTLAIAPFKPDKFLISKDGATMFILGGYPERHMAIFFQNELIIHESGSYFYQAGTSSKNPQLSPDGKYCAICYRENYTEGYLSLYDTHTGIHFKLLNPKSDYDFISGLKFINNDELYVRYGNHDPVIWSTETKEILSKEASLPGSSDIPERWYPEKNYSRSVYSSNGKWLLINAKDTQVSGDIWDMTPELYDAENKALVHSFPTKQESYYNTDIWVEDDGTSWTLTSEKIVVYSPDGKVDRVLEVPEPIEVKENISGAYFKDGEPQWLLEQYGDGVLVHPSYGVLHWKKRGFYNKYWRK